jgi:hypothetical protein
LELHKCIGVVTWYLDWYPMILWDLCLDCHACHLLYYGLVSIKLISSRCLCELWCACWLFCYCTSMLSYICIVAPHIGTLAEMCKGCGIGAKPEDGVWWIHPKDRRIGQVLDWRECSPSEFLLTNSDLSRIPDKPQSIISLLISEMQLSIMLYILLH